MPSQLVKQGQRAMRRGKRLLKTAQLRTISSHRRATIATASLSAARAALKHTQTAVSRSGKDRSSLRKILNDVELAAEAFVQWEKNTDLWRTELQVELTEVMEDLNEARAVYATERLAWHNTRAEQKFISDTTRKNALCSVTDEALPGVRVVSVSQLIMPLKHSPYNVAEQTS